MPKTIWKFYVFLRFFYVFFYVIFFSSYVFFYVILRFFFEKKIPTLVMIKFFFKLVFKQKHSYWSIDFSRQISFIWFIVSHFRWIFLKWSERLDATNFHFYFVPPTLVALNCQCHLLERKSFSQSLFIFLYFFLLFFFVVSGHSDDK